MTKERGDTRKSSQSSRDQHGREQHQEREQDLNARHQASQAKDQNAAKSIAWKVRRRLMALKERFDDIVDELRRTV